MEGKQIKYVIKILSVFLVLFIFTSCSINSIQETIETSQILEETKPTTITENVIEIEETNTTQEINTTQPDITTNSNTTKQPETHKQIPEIPAHPQTIHTHNFRLTIETESTCVKAGQKIFKCECGEKYIETIKKILHNYTLVETNIDKLIKVYQCTNCGNTYEEKIVKPKAIDSDLCGESLIEKILPHAPYKELMSIAFELYHSHYTEDDYDSKYVLPIGMHYVQLQQLLFTSYRYIGANIHFFGLHDEEGIPCIRVYCKTEEDEQAKIVYDETKRILKELNITSSTTQKEAITRINNWLCKQKDYDYSALDDRTKRDSSMYYSLFSDKGVCSNYAIAFQILCLSAGIECHYYSSSTMNHAWNKVYFSDGSYRWVDVTWNDTTNTNKYLLITDKQLLKDHTL